VWNQLNDWEADTTETEVDLPIYLYNNPRGIREDKTLFLGEPSWIDTATSSPGEPTRVSNYFLIPVSSLLGLTRKS
jgi:hypothetical protein